MLRWTCTAPDGRVVTVIACDAQEARTRAASLLGCRGDIISVEVSR